MWLQAQQLAVSLGRNDGPAVLKMSEADLEDLSLHRLETARARRLTVSCGRFGARGGGDFEKASLRVAPAAGRIFLPVSALTGKSGAANTRHACWQAKTASAAGSTIPLLPLLAPPLPARWR